MPVVPVDIIEASELGPEHVGRTVELGVGCLVRGELTGVDQHPGDRRKLLLTIRDDQHGPTIVSVRDSRWLRVWVE